MCKAIDPRHFSSDLPQGGLEVPCRLAFHGTRTVFSPFYRMPLYQSIALLATCRGHSSSYYDLINKPIGHFKIVTRQRRDPSRK